MEIKKLIIAAFVMSGIAALIYEVAWTRPLQMVLLSTTYTYAIIFAAFMAGLGLGALIISRYIHRIKNLPAAFGFLEAGIAVYGAILLHLFNLVPDIYRAVYPLRHNFILFEFVLYGIVFALLLIPTTLMGATFPIVAKILSSEKLGKGVGFAYSANNFGAIIGSIAAGFLLVPLFGIKGSIVVAGVLNLLVAALMLFTFAEKAAKIILPVAAVLFFAFVFTASYDIDEMHSSGYYALFDKDMVKSGNIIFYQEGLHGTVAVKEYRESGKYALLINGKGQGSNVIADWRVNLLLAALPLLANPDANNALVIGLGTGTTSGLLAQAVDTTTVEIEPAILDAAKYFSGVNHNMLENNRHNLVIGDGRHFLTKTGDKWDIIILESSDPWMSFSSALFSEEFFRLAAEHLNDNGIFVQWLPSSAMDEESFNSFYKTFSSVFPNVMVFANIKKTEPLAVRSATTEMLFIGSKQEINLAEMGNNFANLSPALQKDMRQSGIFSFSNIKSLFLASGNEIEGFAENAGLITDNSPLLEFSIARTIVSGASGFNAPEELAEFLKGNAE